MFNKYINKLKLLYVKQQINILKNGNIKKKYVAFKKLDKLKINLDMGFLIIDATLYNYGIDDGNGGINSSLFSLILKDYKFEYNKKILNIFSKYDNFMQDKILLLLSSIDNKDTLELYRDIVLKYYLEKDIPIDNLFNNITSFDILFPKLFKLIKYKKYKNNILVLLNYYLNEKIILPINLGTNKKLLLQAIRSIFNEALKYKFSSTIKALADDNYYSLRYYLEIAVNLEKFIGNKTTSDLLSKLYKKNDAQLKIFILDNYLYKNKNIKNLNLIPIAKDDSSRYALFELLTLYEKIDLFPKLYLKQEKLAKSNLYINFLFKNGYKEVPKKMKLYDSIVINNYKYYIFTFEYSFVNNIIYDELTSYIIKNSGTEKYNNKKIKANFIGISGGFTINDPNSLVHANNEEFLWDIKKDTEKEKDVIDRLLVKLGVKESKKQEKEVIVEENETEIKNEIITSNKSNKKSFKFIYIIFFLLFILIVTIGAFITFLNNPSLINIEDNNQIKIDLKNNTKKDIIKSAEKFREINADQIFKQEGTYYVLLFKYTNKKNSYFTYINKLLDYNYTIYYVDLSKEENRFLYSKNDLGFTLYDERYLKVVDGDFEFYVDEKNNILDELKSEVKSIEAIKKKENTKSNTSEK